MMLQTWNIAEHLSPLKKKICHFISFSDSFSAFFYTTTRKLTLVQYVYFYTTLSCVDLCNDHHDDQHTELSHYHKDYPLVDPPPSPPSTPHLRQQPTS